MKDETEIVRHEKEIDRLIEALQQVKERVNRKGLQHQKDYDIDQIVRRALREPRI